MIPLFESLKLRDVTLPNRIGVSPMCMYSSVDGFPNDWHFVHLGSRAVGGAGLVIAEAAGVTPEGRITADDAGIYLDDHVDAWAKVNGFIKAHGSVPAIQLAHAGRKASTTSGWKGNLHLSPEEGWQTVSASPLPFAEGWQTPLALDEAGIKGVVASFAKAAERALAAGFEVIELHAAHGYLLHQFYSPLSNHRTDAYGGSLENRIRLTVEITEAVRRVWPERLPLFIRISASDWTEGGWDIQQSVELAKVLKPLGVDLVDASSGGNLPAAPIPIGPGYQVPFAETIRREAHIATAAVGMITEAAQANEIIAQGKADLVLLARELLRDPYWPTRAAKELGAETPNLPLQYARAW